VRDVAASYQAEYRAGRSPSPTPACRRALRGPETPRDGCGLRHPWTGRAVWPGWACRRSGDATGLTARGMNRVTAYCSACCGRRWPGLGGRTALAFILTYHRWWLPSASTPLPAATLTRRSWNRRRSTSERVEHVRTVSESSKERGWTSADSGAAPRSGCATGFTRC